MDEQEFRCFDLERVIEGISSAVQVQRAQVGSAVQLLDAGNTIPFIARYRKEATRGLDEQELRNIESLLDKARDLAQRKSTVLKTIQQQGQLTDELRRRIEDCPDKSALEDLYLPFKPKRRTRATIARERGLEPLAILLLEQTPLRRSHSEVLRSFVAPERDVPDEATALQGACDIVAERWSEDAATRSWLTRVAWDTGLVAAQVKRGQDDPSSKFAMYFDYQEACKRVPSHRFLAMQRGETEGVLRVQVKLDDEDVLRKLRQRLVRNPQFEFRDELLATVEDCYARLLQPAIQTVVLQDLKEKADDEAIGVFARNLRELLLAPPAGPQVTMGIDPGFRTGCKVAVVDGTGKYLAHTAIYPTAPRHDEEGAATTLLELIGRFQVKLIAIGNGTASRETDAFVSRLLRSNALEVTQVVVSESGASVYSASELAAQEHPELDVTVRGALSIARRLQDPLAELVKIDPKSIGVGQYQHDVNQNLLRKALDWEVESCVNSVGVEVNMASAPLLAYVAGIGPKLAQRVIAVRNEQGPFHSRQDLRRVPGLGPKAFEQAAGFLRIRTGPQPLDNSAVHPESYYVVEKMAAQLSVATEQLVGNADLVKRLTAEDFVDERVGLPTLHDILAELAKPGRDPRREFRAAQFTEGVQELEDLRSGMVLEGVVTNVTRFGAFVDIGVHQDGLVHVSELANAFVKDPSDVVAVGDVVRVRVLEVDLGRRRIALSRKQAL